MCAVLNCRSLFYLPEISLFHTLGVMHRSVDLETPYLKYSSIRYLNLICSIWTNKCTMLPPSPPPHPSFFVANLVIVISTWLAVTKTYLNSVTLDLNLCLLNIWSIYIYFVRRKNKDVLWYLLKRRNPNNNRFNVTDLLDLDFSADWNCVNFFWFIPHF